MKIVLPSQTSCYVISKITASSVCLSHAWYYGLDLQHCITPGPVVMPVFSACRLWRQDGKVRVSLRYIMSLRTAWINWSPVHTQRIRKEKKAVLSVYCPNGHMTGILHLLWKELVTLVQKFRFSLKLLCENIGVVLQLLKVLTLLPYNLVVRCLVYVFCAVSLHCRIWTGCWGAVSAQRADPHRLSLRRGESDERIQVISIVTYLHSGNGHSVASLPLWGKLYFVLTEDSSLLHSVWWTLKPRTHQDWAWRASIQTASPTACSGYTVAAELGSFLTANPRSSPILFLGSFKSLQLWGTYSDMALDNWGIMGKSSAFWAWRYDWSLSKSCYSTVNSFIYPLNIEEVPTLGKAWTKTWW
jgi:hypothetical protein